MRGLYGLGTGEIGDGAGDLEDAVVSAGAEVKVNHGGAKDLPGIGLHAADVMQGFAPHVGIAVGTGLFAVALLLNLSGANNPFANVG